MLDNATAQERKEHPIYSGFIKYFPKAMAEVAHLSKVGNDQHNPGMPLFWDRLKSRDELDALARHLTQAGTRDTDGEWHDTKVAWRAMANLEKLLEREAEGQPTKAEQNFQRSMELSRILAETYGPEPHDGDAQRAVEGHKEPEWTISASKAEDALRATQGPGNGALDLGDLVGREFIPMTFSRPPNTEDFGPEYEDDGQAVADAVARNDEIDPVPDEDHVDPSYAPERRPPVMVRYTSEDRPRFLPFRA